jgi:uncharacterized protein YdhG (YjbR/CyaY superfamily)
MKTKAKAPANIDEYIVEFPAPIQMRLGKIKEIVRKAAPEAREKISYQMPAFTLKGMLIYFAGFSNHIGLYPFRTAIEAFREELADYQTGKGSIRFPHNKPLPLGLISDIVKFRVMENLAKAEVKTKKSRSVN